MKTKMFVLWAVIIIISCSDNDDSVCGVINPTEDLSWLKNEIEDREATPSDFSKYFYIAQATYKFQTVFVFEDCCPYCNTAIFVFDCKGNRIGQINNGIQRKDVKNTKVIYKPKDFKCE
ncbi:MAG: hypothetical protein WBM98_04145 [Maribacter sp.]|uniref:hypothetical protein n=1 Tax=Maribacter sp. TaxID=1897614 RepID=UPI003C7397BF